MKINKNGKLDVHNIYAIVLSKDSKERFPNGFWTHPLSKHFASECTKYLIEEVLEYNEDTIKEKCSTSLFAKNKLGGMLQICFDNSAYQAINNAYPNKFKEWEFRNTPRGYWKNKENGIKATKCLIEEKLKLTDEELREQLSYNLFKNNGLSSMLQHCFSSSPYEAINTIYPNKFKPWEFKNVSIKYWTLENGIKATKWLIEEKLKLTDDELKEQLSSKLFFDNDLSGVLQYCFKGNLYEAINSVYPNKFKK